MEARFTRKSLVRRSEHSSASFAYEVQNQPAERSAIMQMMRLFLSLLLVQACFAQAGSRAPGYHNYDPPNCGSFHTPTIQGTVTDQVGTPVKDVAVEVFDDVSRKPLWKTATDKAGRFSINQRWHEEDFVLSFPRRDS